MLRNTLHIARAYFEAKLFTKNNNFKLNKNTRDASRGKIPFNGYAKNMLMKAGEKSNSKEELITVYKPQIHDRGPSF